MLVKECLISWYINSFSKYLLGPESGNKVVKKTLNISILTGLFGRYQGREMLYHLIKADTDNSFEKIR